MLSIKQVIFIVTSAVLSVVSLVLFVPWSNVFANLAPLPNTVPELLDDAVARGLDGIIVYIDTKEQEPEFYSNGWKNREQQIPADPHALFKIASITKLYVAAAVAKLADSQVLSLDTTLASYLPSVAGRIENADQITLRMMVQHRSGIPNYSDHPDYQWFDNLDDLDGAVELIFDKPARFKPDSRFGYSNTNYLLIGRIINDALGYGYQQYIKDEILTPLGLNRTFDSLSEIDPGELTSGYTTEYCCDLKLVDYVGPAGSMIATAEDVGVFLRALNDGTLLSDTEQAIYGSIYVYEHTGLLPGYSSIAGYHSDIDTVVVLFINTSGGDTWGLVKSAYNRVLRILRDR